MISITIDDKTVLFKWDKKKGCRSCLDGDCEHTADIEHAVFDGEKSFTLIGRNVYVEEVQQERVHEKGSVEKKN